MMRTAPWTLSLISLLASATALAQETAPAVDEEEGSGGFAGFDDLDGLTLDPLAVTLDDDAIRTIGGSAQALGEEELEQLGYADPQQVLQQLPGVYVRQEDGYGLRPNIGLRGASSDRSKKVTLMEDGVLFGPAPYAAPAAYYFPLINRMTQVEVFKGPSAILFGPNTIGGAINFVSRGVPDVLEAGFDGALGLRAFGRAHAWAGTSTGPVGFMVEGVHLGSTGFREQDGGGGTGFNRTELLARGQVHIGQYSAMPQTLELRLGYSREHSNETYLGLTDADFRESPYRRYSAASEDVMDWDRFEVRLRHRLEISPRTTLRTTAYRHQLSRLWTRLNGIGDSNLASVVSAPADGRNAVYYDVLRGAQDSGPGERLFLAGNQRDFVSQGVQTELETEFDTGVVEHSLRAGARVHNDSIDRNHTSDAWAMVDGQMNPDPSVDRAVSTDNRGEATAIAAHALWSLGIQRLTLAPGVRTEVITTRFRDEVAQLETTDNQQVILPGIGAYLELTNELGLLAGAHQGFSPVAPGQAAEVRPERANNYEFGARYSDTAVGTLVEAVGFFSDYTNLSGDCSFSSGCAEQNLDRQFNAGDVQVFGAEFVASAEPELGGGYSLPFRLSYTFTGSSFRTAFESDNPQYGAVTIGDRLPYIPPHQLFGQIGLKRTIWSVNLGVTFVDRMRETASAGSGEDVLFTDRYAMLDAQARVEVARGLQIYVRGENLNNAQPLASRFPFGARSAKPLQAQLGLSWEL
jgi:Fe(3+) dicitrate transport protein